MPRSGDGRVRWIWPLLAIGFSFALASCSTPPEPPEPTAEPAGEGFPDPTAPEASTPEAAVTYLAPARAIEPVGIPLYEPATPVPAPEAKVAAVVPAPVPVAPAPSPAAVTAPPLSLEAPKPEPAPAATKPAAVKPAPAASSPATAAPSASSATAAKPAPVSVPTPAPAPAPSPAPAATASIAVTPLGAPEVVDPPAFARVPDLEFGIRRGDRFELRVSGSGWTYLGEAAGQEGIAYEHRRFQDGDAIFALSADRVGDYLLDFRRLDPLLGVPESKTARIVVTDAASPLGAPLSGLGAGILGSVTGSRSTLPSPASPSGSSVPPATSAAGTGGASSVPSATATPSPAGGASSVPSPTPGSATSSVPSSSSASSVPSPSSAVTSSGASSVPGAVVPPATPGIPAAPAAAGVASAPSAAVPASESYVDLLRFSRDEIAAGRFESARRALERLVSLYANSGDEPWYLLGRVYEEPGPLRDIRKAHAAYKRVRDEFPESAWWQDAADRVAAIERRYFDIR